MSSVSISQSASFDVGSLSPQTLEAFSLAYPGHDPQSLVAVTDEQLQGYLAAWKGKLFEVIVRDRLNAGESVGPLTLSAGQTAELATSTTQRGWDLRILDDSGETVDKLQLKATESLAYIKHALEKYPRIDVYATDEVVRGAADLGDHIYASGVSLDEVHSHLASPLAELNESPVGELTDSVFPWMPLVVILSTEGIMTLAGRHSFSRALQGALFRIGRSVAIRFSVVVLRVLGFDAGAWVVAPAFHVAISRFQSAGRAQAYLKQWSKVLDAIQTQYGPLASRAK